MTLKRIKDIPLSKDPLSVSEEPRKEVIKNQKQDFSFSQDAKKKIEKELRIIRGSAAPKFKHKQKLLKKEAKPRITEKQQEEYLAASIDGMKSTHQEKFETHLQVVKNAIKRKGYRSSVQKRYLHQLSQIDQQLAELDSAQSRSKDSTSQESGISSSKQHQKWKESVAVDFENLYRLTSREARKRSFFKRKDPQFIAMHKFDVEAKALALVQKIARKIEADHPIPVRELDWIEASLHDVHRDIWGKDS